MNENNKPILVVWKRNEFEEKEDSTTTTSGVEPKSSSSIDQLLDSYGCVICSSAPLCPSCKKNEQCSMSTQTCDKCPTTFCELIVDDISATNTLSSAQIGGIAGGISGLFFIIVVTGIFFLLKRYRKRMDVDFESGIGEEMKGLGQFDDNSNIPGTRQNRNYDSRYNQGKRLSQNSLSTMTNSVLTKASNVLNIGYVPGVTSRPTKPPSFMSRRSRKPGSIYSKTNSMLSKETYFSDLENASINVGKVATKGANLTSININHDEYDFDNDYEEYELNSQHNHDDKYKAKEKINEEINSDSESANIPLNIDFQLRGRRNVNDSIIEEDDFEDGSIELIEEESDDDFENPNAINISDRKHKTMPTRYAALMEKNDQVKPSTTELNPFSSKYVNNAFESSTQRISSSDSGSDIYSDSDSDEENIEFLLHQSGQTPHETQTTIGTRSSQKTSSGTAGNSKNSTIDANTGRATTSIDNVDPFADH